MCEICVKMKFLYILHKLAKYFTKFYILIFVDDTDNLLDIMGLPSLWIKISIFFYILIQGNQVLHIYDETGNSIYKAVFVVKNNLEKDPH